MSDVNANIKVSIDSSQALSELKSLQRQISLFHTNIAKSSAQAALAQRTLQTDLLNAINATGRFSAQMGTIKTSTESFTNSLEKNKFSMREYFRYAAGSTKTFGKLFQQEFNTIQQVAEDRVKKMQTQYIKMGRDAKGAMQAMAITPTQLDMGNFSTKLQITAQRQQLFNQLLKQGSTNLLNFGKNTQWAGRQLMVGFTLPLAMLGSTASKAFMDMETSAIKFKKVYGDITTPKSETNKALEDIKSLANGFTQYGIAASQTVGLAADAAAAGFKGLDLQAQTTQATRLAVLGQIDQQKALETTIALQNTFRISSSDLADSINFLNSVENQTVLSLDDITTAIPIAAPVIKSLGGDVKDLAFFMTAMKEGGISAAQGANALKSGLASMINPSKKASDMLASVGINIKDIVESNRGDLKATVLGIAKALDTLAPLDRARAIETMFGKFQFARISTLFANITRDGTQASRVLDMTKMSVQDLAKVANQELSITADSPMNKFKKAVEDLKVALVPVGQAFLDAVTPVLNTINHILSAFKGMSDGSKKAITLLVAIIGGLGPVLLMTFGLLANGIANIMKLFGLLRSGYLKLTGQSNVLAEQTQYLNSEQAQAAAVASSLEQSHARLTQTFTVEKSAVNQLRDAYIQATIAANKFSLNNPGLMAKPKKYADGVSIVPGSGNTDSVPAMLMPGEAVIPKNMAKKYAPLINGMIANNIPGFANGKKYPSMQGGVARMLAPYTMFAPGNFAGGFGMAKDFLSEKGFAESLRNTAIAAGSVEGDIKLTQSSIDAMAKEVMPYAEKITTVLRDTSENLNKAGTPAKHISELFAAAETDVKQILASMKKEGGRIASVAQGLQKFAYPTAEDITSGGYERVPGVTVDPATGLVMKSTIYSNKRGKAGAFDKKLKRITATQPISGTGIMTKAHVVAENLAIIASESALQGAALKLPMDKQQAAREEIKRKGAIVAGREYAKAYASGLESGGLKDIYLESRKGRHSPHPMAARDGNDDADAYQKALSNRITTYGTTGPVSAIDKSIRRQNDKRLKELAASISVSGGTIGNYNQAKEKQSTRNLESFNKAIMAGSFALTTLGGIGSFASGTIGNLSQQIMKYSGILFGLMNVTQLITQTSMLEVLAKRRSIAAEAIGGVSNIASIFTKGGFIKGLLDAGKYVKSFLGPVGLATTGLFAAYKAITYINGVREKERQSIEGLGNAANISAAQIDKLGKAFGVTPFKGSLESFKPTVVASVQQKSLITQAREALGGDKQYQKDVNALKKANDVQATRILTTRAIKLFSSGSFAKEQVQAIIQAMQEDAGKTKLKLDFESMDLSTLKGKAGIAESAQNLIDQYKVAFAKGYSKTSRRVDTLKGSGTFVEEFLTKDLKRKLNDTASNYAAFFISINDQFEQGKIKASDLNISFDDLTKSISGLTDSQASKLMPEIFAKINDKWPKAVEGIGKLSDQFFLLKAGMAGLDPDQLTKIATALKILENPTDYGKKTLAQATKDLKDAQDAIDKKQQERQAANDKAAKDAKNALNIPDTTTAKTNALQDLQTKTKEIEKQIVAYKQLRKAGVDAAVAQEMAANVDLTKILSDTKYVGDNWNKALAAIKAYQKQQQDLEKMQAVGGGVGDYQQYLFNKADAFISLQEHLIDMQYKTQIKTIDNQLTDLNTQLDNVKQQETQIADKFDLQINALNTIKTLNDNIVNQEKQKLTIADALSKGDISAAAAAMQDARAQQASASMATAQQSLTTAKDNAIAALGAKNIQSQIDALTKQKTVIEDTIQKQKDAITYFGMTSEQIRDAAKALDLANQAGVNINNPTFLNNLLRGATGDATGLKDVMITLQGEARKLFIELQNLRNSFLKTGGGAGGVGVGIFSGATSPSAIIDIAKSAANVADNGTKAGALQADAIASSAIRALTDMNGAPLSGSQLVSARKGILGYLSTGGLVPQYFANGGFSRGTDTVPAMLTPGEFVINKNASKTFGPLLKNINESKYPASMSLGSSANLTGISSNSINNSSNSVYNYSLNISTGNSSASPNDIARIVIGQIKNLEAQRIRGSRYL